MACGEDITGRYGNLCWTFVELSGNRLSQTWEKTPDVAYQDVFKEFDLVLCVEGLIVTQNNLVVTWRVRPWMGIIS